MLLLGVQAWLFKPQMKSSHQICFDILNFKKKISSRINMNIFFDFVKALNKDYMFKIGLSRFMGIQAKFTISFIAFK
jgi:hypothetical protein